jgi:F-type H+-transporting ATPase subunit gamma
MASTRDIRRRIKSVRSTSQITKAMQMVAASKMRKAQQAAVTGRPYAEHLNQALAQAANNCAGGAAHPLMEVREVKRRGVVLVSPDKGMCGGLNGNLFREAMQYDVAETVFVTAGNRAAQFVARTRRQLAAEFRYQDTPTMVEARAISKHVQKMFLEHEVDAVDVLFTNFVTTLTQKPKVWPLLPVGEIRGVAEDLRGGMRDQTLPDTMALHLSGGASEFVFEPGAEKVLGALLSHSLNYQIYEILLEAKASEHSARMVAMKNATENAQKLIKDLTLVYNKQRQAAITSELLEITTATMAQG